LNRYHWDHTHAEKFAYMEAIRNNSWLI
jgi:hypothetical protein